MAQETVIDSLRININANANKAISNLDRLQASLKNTANEIQNFGNNANGLGNWGKGFGKNTSGMAKATAQANKLYNRLNGLRKAGTSACLGIQSAFQKTSSVVKTAVSGMISRFTSLNKSMRGSSLLATSLKTAFGTILGLKGITGVFTGIKDAISMGADITEIDHIVESVFAKNMVNYVHSWANSAIEDFGIASGAAKKYAGTLSAMFQSSGVGQMDAGKMATDLVGLAGDLSAFYNEETEVSFEKIKSGLSGMVRPLRAYGIDLSAATLEEFRLAQGIQTSYSAMTQAEKVMLRYQYLMANTTQQQGDFARTADSMANATRTLRAYVAAVQTQLGVGLAAALRHVIILLREVMKYVLKAATAFATFMQTIFGKYKGEVGGGVVLDDSVDYADDLADSVGDAASGLGDASDAARQLKKDLSVLPFDELNQLNKDHESTSSGSGNAGVGGIGGGGIDTGNLLDGLLDMDGLDYEGSALRAKLNAWATQLKKDFLMHDWEGLGTHLAEGLNKGVQKLYDLLDPAKVREKVDPWINAFTTTLNSFVDKFDFNLLGKTFGRGINNFVHIANQTIEGINWRNIGSKLAQGANGLMDEVDFTEVGNLFGNKIMILWNTLNGFVHDFHWDDLGTSIANIVNGLNEKLDFSVVADTLATGINGIFTALDNFANETHWNEIATNIANGIVTFIDETNWEENSEALTNFITKLCDALTKAVDDVGPEKWEELGQGIADMLAAVPWEKVLKTVGHAIVTALGPILKGLLSEPEGAVALAVIAGLGLIKFKHSAFGTFGGNLVEAVTGETVGTLIKNGFKKLFAKKVAEAAADTTVTTAAETAGKTLTKPIAGGISGLGGTLLQLGGVSAAFFAAYKGITEWEKANQRSAETSLGLNGVLTEMGSVIDRTTLGLQNAGYINAEQNRQLIELADNAETAGYSSEEMGNQYVQALYDMGLTSEQIKGVLDGMTGSVYGQKQSFWDLKNAVEDTGSGVNTAVSGMGTGISGLSSTIANYVQGAAKDLVKNKTDITSIGTAASSAQGFVAGAFSSASSHISDFQQKASSHMATAKASIGSYKSSAKSDLTDNENDFKKNSSGSIASMIKTAAQTVLMTAAVTLMSKSMKTSINSMSDTFEDAFDKIKTSFSSIGEGLKTSFSGLSEIVEEQMWAIKRVLLSQNLELWRMGQEMGQSLANGFSSVRIPMPHMYVAYWQQVNFGDGGYMFYPEFGLQWYRKGGLFQGGSGQMIGIAEDGRDEAVLPLEDKRAMARIGSAIADAGGSGAVMDDRFIDKLANRLAEVIMMREEPQQTPVFHVEVKTENDEVLARAVSRGQRRLDYRNNATPKMAY